MDGWTEKGRDGHWREGVGRREVGRKRRRDGWREGERKGGVSEGGTDGAWDGLIKGGRREGGREREGGRDGGEERGAREGDGDGGREGQLPLTLWHYNRTICNGYVSCIWEEEGEREREGGREERKEEYTRYIYDGMIHYESTTINAVLRCVVMY